MRPLTTILSILLLTVLGGGIAGVANAAEPAPVPRTIDIKVTEEGYAPAKLELTAGETVRLAFHSEADSECAGSVQSEDLGIKPTLLPKGKTTVIEIKAPKAGTYAFACSMSMNTGT